MKIEVDVNTSPVDEIKRTLKKELGEDVQVQITTEKTGQGHIYNIEFDESKAKSSLTDNKIDKINREIIKTFEKRGHRAHANAKKKDEDSE